MGVGTVARKGDREREGKGGGGRNRRKAKLTFLDNVTQIGHVLDRVVREGLLVVLQYVGTQLCPNLGASGQQEKDKCQKTRRGVPGSQEHIDNLVPQHDGVLGILGELLEENVRLLLARIVRGLLHARLFLAAVLEGTVHKLVGVGVHCPAGAAKLLVTVGKHQVAKSQSQNGALLGVVQGLVELPSGIRGVLVHQADRLAKHVLTVGVENL